MFIVVKPQGLLIIVSGQLRAIGQETDQAAGGAKSPLCRIGPRGDAENHPALWQRGPAGNVEVSAEPLLYSKTADILGCLKCGDTARKLTSTTLNYSVNLWGKKDRKMLSLSYQFSFIIIQVSKTSREDHRRGDQPIEKPTHAHKHHGGEYCCYRAGLCQHKTSGLLQR